MDIQIQSQKNVQKRNTNKFSEKQNNSSWDDPC